MIRTLYCTLPALFITMIALGCSPSSRHESLEEYLSGKRSAPGSPIRIALADERQAGMLLTANGGIVSNAGSVLAKSGVRLELIRTDPASREDLFTSFHADMMITSLSEYIASFERITRFNPILIMVTAWSEGRISLASADGSLPEQGVIGADDVDAAAFARMLSGRFWESRRLTVRQSGSAQLRCAETIPPEMKRIISTAELNRFEPYVLVCRSYFLSERRDELQKLSAGVFTQSPPAKMEGTIVPADWYSNALFFGLPDAVPQSMVNLMLRGLDERARSGIVVTLNTHLVTHAAATKPARYPLRAGNGAFWSAVTDYKEAEPDAFHAAIRSASHIALLCATGQVSFTVTLPASVAARHYALADTMKKKFILHGLSAAQIRSTPVVYTQQGSFPTVKITVGSGLF